MKGACDRSIRSDIRRLFVFTIMTCLLTVCAIVFYYWRISINEMIVRVQSELSKSIQTEIEAFIAIPMELNENNRYVLENGIINPDIPEDLARFLGGVMGRADETIYSFSVGLRNGSYYGVRRNKGNQLEFMKSDASTSGRSVYFSLDGKSTVRAVTEIMGSFDVRTRQWYIAAVEQNHPIFSPVYKHFVVNDLAITAASPLYGPDGEFLGVLGTHSMLAKMNEELKAIVQKKGSLVYIVERESGNLIANTEEQSNFAFSGSLGVDRVQITEIKNRLIREGYQRYRENGESAFDEDGVYVNTVSFRQQGLDWLIITAVPQPESVQAIRKSLIISIVLSLLLVLIEGYIWKRKVDHCLQPVSELVQITEKFAAGDFSARAEVVRNNEIGKLADAFNRMAADLERLINDLEQQVQERTQALEEKNTALLKIKADLETALEVDFLTGLYNRKFLIEKIEAEISACQQAGAFGVIMADVDYFKKINDGFGHDCGDTVLKKLADIMKQAAGNIAYTGRWGGEEFLIFVPEATGEAVLQLAEKIRKTVELSSFPCIKSCLSVTLTLGVAVYNGQENLDDIVKKADIAVYYGKKTGRNRVSLFEETMREE